MAHSERQRTHATRGWLALVAVYAAAGWAAVEILSTLREVLLLDADLDRLFLAIFVAGFPVALLVWWWRGRRTGASPVANAGLVLVAATFLAVFSIGLLRVFDQPSAELPSVAVLPCEYSGDSEFAYIGPGLAEDIHNRLTRLSGVRVVGWRSVRNVLKIATSPDEIADRLGVARLADCAVEYGGDTLNITARVVDPHQGLIWSDQYSYASIDLTRALVELAEALATELSVRMSPEELRQVRTLPTTSAEAYRLFLKARSDFDFRSVRPGSVDLPWIDADAYAASRALYEQEMGLGYVRNHLEPDIRPVTDEITADMVDAIDKHRALLLMNPDCSDAYQLMADLWRGYRRLDLALAWNYRLFQREPENSLFAQNMADRYFELGMLDETLAWGDKAAALPKDGFGEGTFGSFHVAVVSFLRGDPQHMNELLDDLLEGARASKDTSLFLPAMQSYMIMGDKPSAVEVLNETMAILDTEDLRELIPRPPERTVGGKMEAILLALVAREAGMDDQADVLLALAHRDPVWAPVPDDYDHESWWWPEPESRLETFHYLDASHRAVTGREPEALDLLEFALETRQGYVGRLYPRYIELVTDPAFESIRNDPDYADRFQAIVNDYDAWLAPMRESVRLAEQDGTWDALARYPLDNDPGS